MRVQQEVTGRGWPYTVIRRAKSDLCIRVGSARLRRPSVSLSIIYMLSVTLTYFRSPEEILGSLGLQTNSFRAVTHHHHHRPHKGVQIW
jgi:hypothetical protein